MRGRWIAVLFALAACGDDDAPVATLEVPPLLDLDDPETCVACHATIVEEWRSSMHAHAHQSADPIYAAMRTLRMERQGEAVASRCGSCHHPLVADRPDDPLATRGVTCRSCHGVAEVRQGVGHAALVFVDDRTLRGPHDLAADASPAHGTGPAAAHLTDGETLCLACHRRAQNPQGAVTCNTGHEHEESADTAATCTGCHMPTVQSAGGVVGRAPHRSHMFLGPHDAWMGNDAFLRGAVSLESRFVEGAVVVTLANRSGHFFPSGFPGRFTVLQAIGKDAAGAEVWQAWREEPPEPFRFGQVWVDAEGEPTLAPFATTLARDTRLRTDETREIRLEPPPEVAEVEVVLRFFLIAPKAARALGLDGDLTAPREVARGSARRAP
ncbi:MAG: multiheme c-type cytochrome [Polyangiales bacterium]